MPEFGQLKNFTDLQNLDLSDTHVTDAGLMQIKKP